MISCGQEIIQHTNPAIAPTIILCNIFNCGFSLVVINDFISSQVAKYAPYPTTYRNEVAQKPRNKPFIPYILMMNFMHSVEFLKWEYWLSCILHLMSQVGPTMIVFANPAKAPLSIPSIKLSYCLLLNLLQNSQAEKEMALSRGRVIKGQQMPLKRFMKPYFLTMSAKVASMVALGFICILTLSVSKIYPEMQVPNPDKLPHVVSLAKWFMSR